MVESRRKLRRIAAKAKSKPVKWYSIRIVFWSMLLALCFVMFFMGYVVGAWM